MNEQRRRNKIDIQVLDMANIGMVDLSPLSLETQERERVWGKAVHVECEVLTEYVQVEPYKIEVCIIIQCSGSHPSWCIRITENFKLPTPRTDPKIIKICEGGIQSWVIFYPSSSGDSVDLIDHMVFTAELKGSHTLVSWYLHL